ncbi:hypothetical protein APS14_10980 [Pseudomonas thivervalensis]|nr:hypothetical protein APS14_10980 [Pseudomonas thivervalensis]
MAVGQFAVMLDTHKFFGYCTTLWRGSLLPLGRAAAPKKAMSAAHSSGSKLPRHKSYPAIAPQIDQR